MIVEMKVPSPGESITEVQIARWIKNDGDFVEKDEELCEIDSDKATLTLNAEADGVIKILVAEGETVKVGNVVCSIDTAAAGEKKAKPAANAAPAVKAEAPKAEVPAKEAAKADTYASGVPSPAAQKIMAEKGLASSDVSASGKDGRITKGDALSAKVSIPKSANAPVVKGFDGTREQRREKMTMLRKKVAQRLVAVKNETAMLTTFNEVDMSPIMNIRKQYKDKFKETYGVNVGFMSFFTKAVTEALKLYPSVNAMIDGEEIIFHDYADIGVAVSAPKGLMVPVLRNAESMSLAEIEGGIANLAKKARDGKLTIDEMTGGTFTITNGGVFGSMMSTPIINPPQSAILGMHNIIERPMAVNGEVVIRPMMYVALSYDHRIIDGRESVGFLVKVKEMLENPVKMLFTGEDPIKVLLGL
jgi:2-oxoglutarate dehydrogenase E2 component (dihydrolipoamide succinyltransferase)